MASYATFHVNTGEHSSDGSSQNQSCETRDKSKSPRVNFSSTHQSKKKERERSVLIAKCINYREHDDDEQPQE